MQRLDLLALLNGYRDRNQSDDFTITVSPSESRSVNMTIIYFKAEGLISNYFKFADPDKECCFGIEGFTGYTP